MSFKIPMQRHYGEACDGRYAVVPFHVPAKDQNDGGGWKNFQPKRKVMAKLAVRVVHEKMGVVQWFFR